MTTAVTTTNERSAAVQVIDGPTLKELAATANHEHQQVLAAAEAMVQHAIKVGEALQAARAHVKHGDWRAWLEDYFEASHQTAETYMRIALYREHLPSDVGSINQARHYLRWLPVGTRAGGFPAAVRDEALRKRTKRDDAARKIGGSISESYSQIRKTLQTLDRAHGDTTDRDQRAALSAAISKLHHAEDQIVRILGVE